MKTSLFLFVPCAAALALSGCSSPVPPRAPRADAAAGEARASYDASTLTTADFDRSAVQLVESMLTDDAFSKKLERLRAKLDDDRLPVIVVQKFDNRTSGRNQERLDSMGRDVRIRLRKSGLFDVKDDAATQSMVDRIKRSEEGGLESGELLSAFRNHVSPDYILTGELVDFQDERRSFTYKFYLALHDLSARSGDGGIVVWEDSCVIEKQP